MKQSEVAKAIRNFATFKASALSGYPGSYDVTGRLSERAKHHYEQNQSYISYTIFSYDTPIAYCGRYGWVIFTDKYSVTTSRHTNIVREALSDKEVTLV